MKKKELSIPVKRNFFVFLSIFCVTVFSVSIQMAFKYKEFCNNSHARRMSKPEDQKTTLFQVAENSIKIENDSRFYIKKGIEEVKETH